MAVAKRVWIVRSSAVRISSPTNHTDEQTDELLDEARPTCVRCRKAGVKCGGYIRPIQFVDARCRHLATQIQASDVEPKSTFVSKDPAFESIMPTVASQKSLLCPEIGFRAFQDNVYMSFLDSKLFIQQPGSKRVLGHCINVLLRQNTTETALSLAAHSLAASFFGSAHQRPDIMTHGAQMYGLALQSLLVLLSDPQRCRSYETMACVNALELYEVIFLNSFVIRDLRKSLTCNTAC